jgi:uncharacterized protein (DUF2126 family)/transglutaminase-like putative cysteine protease
MSIRVALNHKTSYTYAKNAWLSPQVVRLRPAPHCRTPILSYSLKVEPKEHFINWQQDPYGNRLARLVFPKQTKKFSVEVDLIAEMTVINAFDFFIDTSAEMYPFAYDAVLAKELIPYFETLPLGPKLLACYRKSGLKTIDFLVELNQKLCGHIKYLIRMEPGIQTPEQTLALRSGSCRDTSWLLVQLLRHLGLAARFASGYLIQLTPDVKSLDGPSGTAVDFTDLHAWAEVYLPGAGWIGLDPTSGLLTAEGHIPLACSADPTSAAAITGFCSFDDEEVVTADPEDGTGHGDNADSLAKDGFTFAMSVTRIHEDPRVTKPYTEAQWAQIESLGHQVDAVLKQGDVRLTMGGEPTFVSIDDMDGPEWTFEALGPMKYKRGDELIRRLREKFAPNGFLHHGQGKWYPGEPLPRWANALYWRKDGQPIWKDTTLIADEQNPFPHTENDSRTFIVRLAERLGVEPHFVIPGFEDVWYYLWKERRLPTNVDPLKSQLENEQERARLARLFEKGLDKITGFALPIRRDRFASGSGAWVSGEWFLRPERMYLIPGDSPMGYRLPLDSLPWVDKKEFPFIYPQDPWAQRYALPPRDAISQSNYLIGHPEPFGMPGQLEGFEQQERDAAWRAGVGDASGSGTGGGTGGGTDGGTGAGPGDPKHDPARAEWERRHRSATPQLPPARGQSAPWLVRTALCSEIRGNALRIFMPPVRYLEDYLELVTAVEDTAADLGFPVLIEGYTPPYDPRLRELKVTPDPGVIEVNTPPVENWDDLVKNTNIIYEEARLTRLGTEKFMLDGRHTGTGGGNHIVIGGASPADSPLLRRPDLLRSLVGYWHNHPSLSFLFSGLFVGPTSQAPRVDEARNDQIYEMEVAFSQVPDKGEQCLPWLVDRIFRNLLVDVTGNTHRAEFCIDKLYPPESLDRRLGLLEMRAFEMPPHARMSLTQHLLLRSLIARFWNEPYKAKLVHWGTEVHDRFMLPHWVGQDLDDVLYETQLAGFPIQKQWFDPHMEFRFPHFGTVQQHGLNLELRQAIEPWHVLGEEPAGGGTVRYVDSSLERLQVKVDGMIDTRHIVACNGVRVPLFPTGVNGQYVAGIRYKAWDAPNALHPTIRVHSPLVFDIYDTWSNRSIGGCTYYVSHPGGRSFDRLPVNSYEAEGRRISRFYTYGHTPGTSTVKDPPLSRELPFTLDLRRA